MIDLYTPPLWTPPRPAIIRAGRIERAPLPIAAMLPGMVPIIAGAAAGGGALTLTYIGQATSTTDLTTYDFGNFNAPAAGLMIVAFEARGSGSRTVSSVSIGGTNGTIHNSNASAPEKWALASRAVSAGNNNVTVTLSGSNGSSSTLGVGVWLLENYASATPIGSDGNRATSGTGNSTAFNYDAGSFGVYGVFHNNNNATSWSSATSRFDANVGGGRISFADKFSASAITPHTETASWTGNNPNIGVGGSWK
jgi:hypothetical protein